MTVVTSNGGTQTHTVDVPTQTHRTIVVTSVVSGVTVTKTETVPDSVATTSKVITVTTASGGHTQKTVSVAASSSKTATIEKQTSNGGLTLERVSVPNSVTIAQETVTIDGHTTVISEP